jgi:hypothetical protein
LGVARGTTLQISRPLQLVLPTKFRVVLQLCPLKSGGGNIRVPHHALVIRQADVRVRIADVEK